MAEAVELGHDVARSAACRPVHGYPMSIDRCKLCSFAVAITIAMTSEAVAGADQDCLSCSHFPISGLSSDTHMGITNTSTSFVCPDNYELVLEVKGQIEKDNIPAAGTYKCAKPSELFEPNKP